MQTDDVSTIAAQIANQAELIYQAWKTTDLHPSDLIRYHSIASSQPTVFETNSPFLRQSLSPPNVNKVPIRNFGPAPPGASPITPRKVIDIPILTDQVPRSFNRRSASPSKNASEATHNSHEIKVQTSISPQYKKSLQSVADQQHSPLTSSRSLNTSPRPYVSPTNSDLQNSTSSRFSSSDSDSSAHSARSYSTIGTNALGIQRTSARNGNAYHPPPPPERSSSHTEPQTMTPRQNTPTPQSELEDSLRELVHSLSIDEKTSSPKSNVSAECVTTAASTSIQDALNRFEKQMTITSRNGLGSSPINQPKTTAINYSSPNDLSLPRSNDLYGTIQSTRRSKSPSSFSNSSEWDDLTSTWPLKKKQSESIQSQGSYTNRRPTRENKNTNYVTTLTAQVGSQKDEPAFIHHKVINIPISNSEGENIIPRRNGADVTDNLSRSFDKISNMSFSTNRKPETQSSLGQMNFGVFFKPEEKSSRDFLINKISDSQLRSRPQSRDSKSFSAKISSTADSRILQAKSKFETNDMSYEAPWRSITKLEVGSTLPEFYRRKLRKMRKIASPEPPGSSAPLPHPELTDQQKAHIRERSQSPTVLPGQSSAVRPFLTQGSVAERVMLFEKAPTEPKKTSPSIVIEEKRPSYSWKDPEEVKAKAQDVAVPVAKLSTDSSRRLTPDASKNLTTDSIKNTSEKDGSLSSKVSAPLLDRGYDKPQAMVLNGPASPLHSTITPGFSAPIPSRKGLKDKVSLLIPRFYYPLGRPMPVTSQDELLQNITKVFRDSGGRIQRGEMGPLMKACGLPLYWKSPLFVAASGEKLGHLSEEVFIDYFKRLIVTCHDSASKFVRILSGGSRSHLLAEDFFYFVQDVVDTHPGLTFLKEATEFHSRYVHTVIARIFYCVNRSWSGKISIPEIRRSNLLQVIQYLEEEDDINKISDYFSYEHFYVIYCKFWELDADHDLFIDRNDLAKHNDRALSDKIIDRIFSGAVTRGKVQKTNKMSYQDFVWFLISEEDKRHPTAIEYWFRCMDLDGDGYLSMYELEYFYEDQLMRMESLGIETLPFSDCLCQMLDMVRPTLAGLISLSDLKKCRMTAVFFDTFFNFDKYLDHEQRDPFASHRLDEDGVEISDWDRYAAFEYELLVAEESGQDCQEDMMYGEDEAGDELSMGVDRALDVETEVDPDYEDIENLDLDHEELEAQGIEIKGIDFLKKPRKQVENSSDIDTQDIDINRTGVDFLKKPRKCSEIFNSPKNAVKNISESVPNLSDMDYENDYNDEENDYVDVENFPEY